MRSNGLKIEIYDGFLGDSKERVEKLASVLSDYDIEAAQADQDAALAQGQIYIMEGGLQSGFELSMIKLAVITEEELFKSVSKAGAQTKLTNAERIKSYSELQIGDYVVHVNHGIGKYLGIETLEINGIHKDYLNIHYQEATSFTYRLTKLIRCKNTSVPKVKSRSFINSGKRMETG